MEKELLRKVKDEVAKANHFADWFQIDMTDMEQCQRDEIKAMMLDDVAIKYAEAYAAKLEQKQHLVELMKMDKGQTGEQCFTEEDMETIRKLWFTDQKMGFLNSKASQYATDRAKKALETFSKDYELTVGGSLMMRIRISEQLIEVVGAIDGYGHSVADQISIIEITNPKNLEV